MAVALSRFALKAHGPVGTASPRHLSRRRFRSKLGTVSSLTCSRPLVGFAFVEGAEVLSLRHPHQRPATGHSQPQAVAPTSAAIASSRIINGSLWIAEQGLEVFPGSALGEASHRSHTHDSGIVSQLSADYQWHGWRPSIPSLKRTSATALRRIGSLPGRSRQACGSEWRRGGSTSVWKRRARSGCARGLPHADAGFPAPAGPGWTAAKAPLLHRDAPIRSASWALSAKRPHPDQRARAAGRQQADRVPGKE
jgi:hypothetical protein